MAGGFGAAVPGPVDARGRGDVLVDVVFGARGRRRALVGDEPGGQPAALAFDLRVDAPLGRGRADHGVGFEVAELMARVHLLRPVRDRHAHRDARPPRPPALRTRAVPLAARQVLPEVQRPLRFRVDPLVEARVADPHMRVVGPFDLHRPSILSGVHPFLSASMTHAGNGEYAMRMGLRGWRARCSAFLCAVMAE